MSIDYSKLQFFSRANTFKNTGVFTTSIVLSGTIPSGTERTFTSVITLAERQVFVFAEAKYAEFTKFLGTGATTKLWQRFPTFDAYIPTTPTGNLAAYMTPLVNGTTVTFKAGIFNPYAGTETITSTTIDISYVTYTLAR